MEKMKLHPQLTIRIVADQKCFGPGIAALLHRVQELHSLRAAAADMAMAYSKAWTILHQAEQELGCKLLYSSVGGKHGGGATLTQEAELLLAAYEAYCERLNRSGETLFHEIFSPVLQQISESKLS